MMVHRIIGTASEFIVTSANGDGTALRRPHHVVLGAFGGLGMCDCADWRFRVQPKLERLSPSQLAAIEDKSRMRCKHLRALVGLLAQKADVTPFVSEQ